MIRTRINTNQPERKRRRNQFQNGYWLAKTLNAEYDAKKKKEEYIFDRARVFRKMDFGAKI